MKTEKILNELAKVDDTILHSTNGLATQEAWRQRGRLIVNLMENENLTREQVLDMIGSPYRKPKRNGKQLIVDRDSRLALISFPSPYREPGFEIEFLNFSGDAHVESEGWRHKIGPQVVKLTVPLSVTLTDGRDASANLTITVEEVDEGALGLTYMIVADAKDVREVDE